jgi:hypothetical protein
LHRRFKIARYPFNHGKQRGMVLFSRDACLRAAAKRSNKQIATTLLVSALMMTAWTSAYADEGGASFWLPGQYAGLVAVPPTPGWSLSTDFYYYSGGASASETFTHGETLSLGRVAAIGPQIGYTFKVRGQPWYANLRGYYEFWAENRYEGYAVFATLNIPLSSPEK